jgi:outer membrane protein assembly factor BamB
MGKGAIGWIAAGGLLLAGGGLFAMIGRPAEPGEVVSSYRLVEGWVPDSEALGTVTAVDVDRAGNVYAFRRDGRNIWKLDPDGNLLEEMAPDAADWAHGIRLDREGFIWTVDGRGNQVKKWSPDGREVLLTLGRYGETGEGPDTFNRPADVAFAANGDIFVADGYGNARVVRFDRDGRFITAWGERGTGPGQFNLVHTIVIDARGRVLVGDRENARIQIFDVDGTFLDAWTHLGSPYGLYLTEDDRIYVADLVNARIWIARAGDGELEGVIDGTDYIHWVAVDPGGNVFTATPAQFPSPEEAWYLRKYERTGAS